MKCFASDDSRIILGYCIGESIYCIASFSMEFVIVLKSLQILPKEKSRCKYKFSCLLFRVRYTRPNKLLIKLRSMECQISEVQYTADHLIWPMSA